MHARPARPRRPSPPIRTSRRAKNIVIDPAYPDRDLFVYDRRPTPRSRRGDRRRHAALRHRRVERRARLRHADRRAQRGERRPRRWRSRDLGNRMFTNEIAATTCTAAAAARSRSPTSKAAEPADAGDALATPYGVAISGDDSTLVVTAVGSSRVFTMTRTRGDPADRLDLGASARRLRPADAARRRARARTAAARRRRAYVLNTLENTVSVVDVSNPSDIGRGRDSSRSAPIRRRPRCGAAAIAFNSGFASSTGTFSCGELPSRRQHRPAAVAHRRRVLPRAAATRATSRARRCRSAVSRTRCRCTGTARSAIPFGGGNGAVGLGGTDGDRLRRSAAPTAITTASSTS